MKLPAPGAKTPDSGCIVLLDSLNRQLLGAYGGREFEMANLDRFAAQRAARFTRPVTGSLPCMPARRRGSVTPMQASPNRRSETALVAGSGWLERGHDPDGRRGSDAFWSIPVRQLVRERGPDLCGRVGFALA